MQICKKKNLINFVVELSEHRLGICLVGEENFDRNHHLKLKKSILEILCKSGTEP